MQFPQQLVTEITAPNNVPFTPGNSVTGFGTTVPPELLAAGYPNAIIFYDTDWDPAATAPRVKYRFIASKGGLLTTGYGYCANPSVSQTAVVVGTTTQGMLNVAGVPVSDFEFRANNGTTIFQFTTYGGGTNDPSFQMYDQNGVIRGALFHLLSTGFSTLQFGNWQLNVQDGTNFASVTHPVLRDGNWQAFTLFNGWTGLAAPDAPLYRMMPDGTVQMTGIINKTTAPTNGEQWGSVASTHYPRGTAAFHCPSAIATTGTQKIVINTNGTCNIYDCPAGNGSALLTPIRYPQPELP